MMTEEESIHFWLSRAKAGEAAVNGILSSIGSPSARVYSLNAALRDLESAPVDVQVYFRESIVCLENNLFRSSIVVSWSGFFSVFCESLLRGKENDIRKNRPKWIFEDAVTLREIALENHILQVAKDTGFVNKGKYRMLDGWLAQRNQCAHPTIYRPPRDTAIGYVASMIDETLSHLQQKK